MGRLVNGERRITDPRPENAGKLLIFCEGATEFNYLNYFKIYLENNLKAKYSDIVLEPIDTGGNAKHVYDYAEAFLDNVQNAAKYSLYEKHLVFDCDAPENIQDVITLMISSKNEYVLDYSNLMFETWLIMHFMQLEPDIPLNKREIHRFMREYLQITKYSSKVKAAPGTIGKIDLGVSEETIVAGLFSTDTPTFCKSYFDPVKKISRDSSSKRIFMLFTSSCRYSFLLTSA